MLTFPATILSPSTLLPLPRSTLLARRQRHRQPISLSQLRDARAALEKEYLHQAQYRPANAATTTTTTTTAARAPQHAHPQPLKAKRDLPVRAFLVTPGVTMMFVRLLVFSCSAYVRALDKHAPMTT